MDADPLLPQSQPLVGFMDYRGRPIFRSNTGGWGAALFVIVLEIAERFSYYGISSNLITYLTGPLGESNASAAAAVNAWSGTASMLPVLGAFLADSYLGRYRTIALASLLYVLGYAMLTLSSMLPSLRPPTCDGSVDPATCRPSSFQIGFFYISLYLVAVAQGGDKPCGLAFGADQFDPNDPKESIYRSSFFNWWYFSMSAGITTAVVTLSYVQDNVSWGLGFGIPCVVLFLAFIVFLLGTKMYRLYIPDEESPLARIGKALMSSMRSRGTTLLQSKEARESQNSLIMEGECAQSARHVKETKGVLRLLPIWFASLVYGVVFAQITTFFNKQGRTLDRRIGSSFQLPPAALQSFGTLSIIAFIPIYDRIIVPAVRKFSKKPTGISMLQRIGIGMVISFATMVISAMVEMKRLKTARDFGLVDQPTATIPMGWWWLVPQYVMIGIGDVFTIVGLQEFFYDQVPDAMRSLGLALYLSILGIGSFISSILISVIDKTTRRSGDSWFSNNLNRAHLDYFYWLLAGLGALELALFLYFAHTYVYKKKNM